MSDEAANNPSARFEAETCGACGKRFTTHANAPSHIERSEPYRHEIMPNVVLCFQCFKRCQALEDGAFL